VANTILIKRSSTTATPPTLAVGELAYSELSDNLFIGKTGAVVAKIGGLTDVTKLAGIESGAQVNTVNSVAGKTGNVTLAKADVGLSNVDNTSDANKPVSTAQQTALDLKANLASPTFTGNVTLGNSTPTSALHAASKAYVDTMSLGITVKDPVVTGTTANISLTGLQTIDGVTVSAGQRVLVKNQTDATQNGIYDASASAWSRSADFDNSPGGDNSEVRNGSFILIQGGTTQKDTQWTLSTTGSISLGTTALSFTQFGSLVTYSAGTGLSLTGTTFAIDGSVLTTASTLDVTKFSSGTAAAFNGSAITNLSATNIATGTISDTRLSANVLLTSSTIDAGTF
jgi:hypothetical protein